jgi:hypothetical protein
MPKSISRKARRVQRRRKARIARSEGTPPDAARFQWRNPVFWVLALTFLVVTVAAIFMTEPNNALAVLEVLMRALLSYPQRR